MRLPDALSEEGFAAISFICAMSAVSRVAPSRPITAESASFIRGRSIAIAHCSSKKRVRLPRKQRLPIVLSHGEAHAVLAAVRNPIHKTCFQLMYACGLLNTSSSMGRLTLSEVAICVKC
jgi:hypothetical protein